MQRVGKALLLLLTVVALVATGVVSAAADPIHVPGGPRLTGGSLVGPTVPVAPTVSLNSGFTPIHVPGGP